MKPATVFLGEMTTLEVEAFLKNHQTVIVPTGSIEHTWSRTPRSSRTSSVPQEVARRIAPRLGAVVAP